MKILLAEDDNTSRLMMCGLLRKWGFDPINVSNGALAWNVMQQPDAPRLLLLDWNMPKMDGIDVIHRVRATFVDDPPYIILITSKIDKLSIITGLDSGANDYILKPYDPDELHARLRVGQRLLELQTDLRTERDARAYEATHDMLTGAWNRRAMLELMSREMPRSLREHMGLCVGLCDIDHFKMVNDTYGHQIGDGILLGLVRLLENLMRPYDSIGRWGGEEFLILSQGCCESAVRKVFERLCINCAQTPITTDAGDISITLSIGVAVWNGQDSSDTLLLKADTALYSAKHQGRNRICIAETSSNE